MHFVCVLDTQLCYQKHYVTDYLTFQFQMVAYFTNNIETENFYLSSVNVIKLLL